MVKVIGQKRNLDIINSWVNSVPHSVIIYGNAGSGRHTLARYMASLYHLNLVEFDNKACNVDEMLSMLCTDTTPQLIILNEFSGAVISVQNSLLKTLEEPPRNKYFVLICQDINTLIVPIKSRCILLSVAPYSQDDLGAFCKDDWTPRVKEMAMRFFTFPDQFMSLAKLNAIEYFDYCTQFIENVSAVSCGNALKSTNKLVVDKTSKDGIYDLEFFMYTVLRMLVELQKDSESSKFSQAITFTTEKLAQLRAPFNFNRRMICDTWVLGMQQYL